MEPLGDRAALLTWDPAELPSTVRDAFAAAVAESLARQAGIRECVVAFESLAVYYDPLLCAWSQLTELVTKAALSRPQTSASAARMVQIPVCYGGEFGPDLAEVARHCCLTEEEVIDRHQQGRYVVRMIGFSPGFPYLSGTPDGLAMPRHATPRLRVPAGSVGIADALTCVYPSATPGGWRLIGRTPRVLFRPDATPPCLLRAGDEVQFVAMSVSGWQEWQERGGETQEWPR